MNTVMQFLSARWWYCSTHLLNHTHNHTHSLYVDHQPYTGLSRGCRKQGSEGRSPSLVFFQWPGAKFKLVSCWCFPLAQLSHLHMDSRNSLAINNAQEDVFEWTIFTIIFDGTKSVTSCQFMEAWSLAPLISSLYGSNNSTKHWTPQLLFLGSCVCSKIGFLHRLYISKFS